MRKKETEKIESQENRKKLSKMSREKINMKNEQRRKNRKISREEKNMENEQRKTNRKNEQGKDKQEK